MPLIFGGDGGLIVLDAKGNYAMRFNTSGMYRGTIGSDGVIRWKFSHRLDESYARLSSLLFACSMASMIEKTRRSGLKITYTEQLL